MSDIVLSKRLSKVAEYVVPGKALLDIGSDHAYLPISLIQKQIVPFAIAGEVALGPYNHACLEVEKAHLTEVIDVRLGSGFQVLKPTDMIYNIAICGMGGSLIREILIDARENELFPEDYRLILQANNSEFQLRKWLADHFYQIIFESILEEKGKIYEIIVAEPTDYVKEYTEEELFFGPLLLQEKSPVFTKKWNAELIKLNNISQQLAFSNDLRAKELINQQIQWIEKVNV